MYHLSVRRREQAVTRGARERSRSMDLAIAATEKLVATVPATLQRAAAAFAYVRERHEKRRRRSALRLLRPTDGSTRPIAPAGLGSGA